MQRRAPARVERVRVHGDVLDLDKLSCKIAPLAYSPSSTGEVCPSTFTPAYSGRLLAHTATHVNAHTRGKSWKALPRTEVIVYTPIGVVFVHPWYSERGPRALGWSN